MMRHIPGPSFAPPRPIATRSQQRGSANWRDSSFATAVAWRRADRRGYRGEMECIVLKSSAASAKAAIELFMKTHGGRSFLHGHLFGDNVHEYLAPCIYEGEGEMLAMGFFKSLVKHHGKTYFEPIGKALQAAGIKRPTVNPAGVGARDVALPYATLSTACHCGGSRIAQHAQFWRDAEFACDRLQ
jgi:hypothetical protein